MSHFATTLIAFTLLLSLFGNIILYFHLKSFKLTDLYFHVASDKSGLIFSLLMGLVIFITIFAALLLTMFSREKIKEKMSLHYGGLFIISLYQLARIAFLSTLGFLLFYDIKGALIASVIWTIFSVLIIWFFQDRIKYNDIKVQRYALWSLPFLLWATVLLTNVITTAFTDEKIGLKTENLFSSIGFAHREYY